MCITRCGRTITSGKFVQFHDSSILTFFVSTQIYSVQGPQQEVESWRTFKIVQITTVNGQKGARKQNKGFDGWRVAQHIDAAASTARNHKKEEKDAKEN